MSHSHTIRPAVLADYEATCELFAQIDALHRNAYPDRFQKTTPAREVAYFRTWLEEDTQRMLVAEVAHTVAGVLTMKIQTVRAIPILKPRTYLLIETLVVDPAFRRQGIGRGLMQAAYEWAAAHHLDEVELGVWAFNEGALHFYRALGFETYYHRMHLKFK